MQNRVAWAMGTIALVALLVALGLALGGYRSGSRAPASAGRVGADADADPMAPRFLDRSGSIRVHVTGAVRKPGVYALPAWARVTDAVRKAGGPTPSADLDAINLADFLRDGEQLRVPYRGRPAPASAHAPTRVPPAPPPTAGGHRSGRYPFAAVAGSRRTLRASPAPVAVDLNTATRAELEALPGIGPRTAEAIVAYRETHGVFLRAEDLMNVRGIGPKKFEQLRPWIRAP